MHTRRWLIAASMVIVSPAASHEVLHGGHDHQHAPSCGHMAVMHQGHSDFLHEGHLHSGHSGHVDEHVLEVSTSNPAAEKRVTHTHAAGDGHPTVQHGAHFDCIHDGRLHHAHGDHADDHGAVQTGS